MGAEVGARKSGGCFKPCAFVVESEVNRASDGAKENTVTQTATEAPIDAEVVDRSTGEVLAIREEAPHGFSGYAGVASLAIPQAEAAKLMAVLPDNDHDILPTGEVYVAQVHYRRLLNNTFGPGSWALVPRGEFVKQGKTICREYALVVRGRFVAEAVGEQDYHESNDRMSYASAAEGVKSNALTRCCKDLGIASECWDKRWCEKWIAKYAVQVWIEKGKDGKPQKPQWRRKDAANFWNETGFVQPKNGNAQRAVTPQPHAEDTEPETPPADAPSKPEEEQDDSPIITIAQRRYLFARAKDYGFSEGGLRKAVAQVNGGDESTSKLTARKMDTIIANMEAAAMGVAQEPR